MMRATEFLAPRDSTAHSNRPAGCDNRLTAKRIWAATVFVRFSYGEDRGFSGRRYSRLSY
jgi:hypothetical protein